MNICDKTHNGKHARISGSKRDAGSPPSTTTFAAKRFLVGIGLLVIVLATLLTYIPAIRAGFIWNDNTYVYQNRLLAEPSLASLAKIWSLQRADRADGRKYWAPHTEQYYPIVFSSFWLESHFWSNSNPTGFHVVNILLHAANAVLIWVICRHLGFAWGFLAGLVFALHPMAVESVAWITERKNVLSTFFYLPALLSYLRFAKAGRWIFYFGALACFVLALLSKTVTCTLPVVLLLILWLRHKRLPWAELPRLIPFFVIGAVLGLLTAYLERHSVGATGAQWQIAFWQRCVIAGKAVFFYLYKLIWPVNLTFIYPRWEPANFSRLELLWPIAVVSLTAGLWHWRKKTGPGLPAAWTCFLVSLFPALGFFDVYPFRYSFVADHFGYLALIFAIALFVDLGHWLYKRFYPQPFSFSAFPVIPAMMSAVLLLLLGGLSYQQAGIYKNSKTLWEHTTAKNSQAWMAWNNLGAINLQDGNLPAAEQCYRRFLELRPNDATAQANYGAVLVSQAQFDRAINYLRRAIELQPDHVGAHLNLANAYAQLPRYDLAVATYKKTIQLAEVSSLAIDRRSRRIQAFSGLADLYARAGQYSLAVGAAENALRLARDYGLNEQAKRIEMSLQHYRRRSNQGN